MGNVISLTLLLYWLLWKSRRHLTSLHLMWYFSWMLNSI